MEPTTTALSIANRLLEITGDAMQRGDFDAFAECFSLPLVMETFEGKQLLQTRSDIQTVFDAVRSFRAANAIHHIVRENVAAQFVDAETISATHVSRMLQKGDILFGRPYPAYSIIKRINDHWRITYCQYAVDEPSQLNAALGSKKEKAPHNPAAPLIS